MKKITMAAAVSALLALGGCSSDNTDTVSGETDSRTNRNASVNRSGTSGATSENTSAGGAPEKPGPADASAGSTLDKPVSDGSNNPGTGSTHTGTGVGAAPPK